MAQVDRLGIRATAGGERALRGLHRRRTARITEGAGAICRNCISGPTTTTPSRTTISPISVASAIGRPDGRTLDKLLREMGDWDLFLRLTSERPPLALPAVACYYTTDAPNRLTRGPTFEADLAAVRAENRR